jgi:hypothetical protein
VSQGSCTYLVERSVDHGLASMTEALKIKAQGKDEGGPELLQGDAKRVRIGTGNDDQTSQHTIDTTASTK